MKHKIIAITTLLLLVQVFFSSCKKYLNVVPDNVATIDNAFALRIEAEKYLFTCYSYLPQDGTATGNIGFTGGDEIWLPKTQLGTISGATSWYIALGNQNVNNPWQNQWDNIPKAIRVCNTFLENVTDLSKVPDLTLDERMRWIGEVQFLKAYYHYVLLRMYGPIPVTDKNIPVYASPDEVKVSRVPFDSCVTYISNLLDSAAVKLPDMITETANELGRVTKPIALSVKAKLLVMAASPLFNGNADYAGFKNKDGASMFSATYSAAKWQLAASACKAAVDACEGVGMKLYEFPGAAMTLSDTTKRQMSIRNAITERWNSERVWGLSNSLAWELQAICMGVLVSGGNSKLSYGQFAAPLKMAQLFYTKNGVPINEDKTLDFSNLSQLRIGTHDERFYIGENYTTARLNFDREPRFYADLGFDGGVWYMYNSPTGTDEGTYVMQAKFTQFGNNGTEGFYNETGYFIKKLVDWNFSATNSASSVRFYEWPEVRLADLYLLYAEALNEANGAPVAEEFTYLNKIRARAGIPAIEEAWTNFSNNPTKFTTKEGMRAIIKQERGIELAFEGSRFWDLRRWKDAVQLLNQPITGWSIYQSTALSYYQPRAVYQQQFVAPRDYLWPIKQYNFTVNPNLVQNPGW
ncbi:Starch-binding associating with outer membrane [Filimonas lacunae]|uniref:Starch-binding associating with outer membrane n=1 Tax=Filimonas lacunae TaxID=477680 RepID=A0A173MP75_9BACT|nr:RagB/SusD family nutrient uptake outer membrane protein [Filimonas lacunae]BAV09463.1 outer membrane protein, nutrient binding [Filimonas lacunae]SIS73634.1 Starch-binding associating with outer membrane [Filimonas lacunae]